MTVGRRKDDSGGIVTHAQRVWCAQRNDVVGEHSVLNVTIKETAVLAARSRHPIRVADHVVERRDVCYRTAHSRSANVAADKAPSVRSSQDYLVIQISNGIELSFGVTKHVQPLIDVHENIAAKQNGSHVIYPCRIGFEVHRRITVFYQAVFDVSR